MDSSFSFVSPPRIEFHCESEMGRRTKRGKESRASFRSVLMMQVYVLTLVLDLSRMGLLNHDRALICQQVIKVLIRA
jgi:hypothetical protein